MSLTNIGDPAIARVISIKNDPRDPASRVMDVHCPYCRSVHRHQADGARVQEAPCSENKTYQVAPWPSR